MFAGFTSTPKVDSSPACSLDLTLGCVHMYLCSVLLSMRPKTGHVGQHWFSQSLTP